MRLRPTANEPDEGENAGLGLAARVAMLALLVLATGLTRRDQNAAFVGGVVLLYVLYMTESVKIFHDCPRAATAITFAIGGLLWMFVLQRGHRMPAWASLGLILVVPPLSALAILRLAVREETSMDEAAGPSTVGTLLRRSKGLGHRATPIEATAGPDR